MIAAVTALAAGAMLAMIADTMIPEAFAEAHGAVGLVAGFLAAFELLKLGGRPPPAQPCRTRFPPEARSWQE